MASKIPIRRFSGLNTTGLEDGRDLTEFVSLQNFRLTKGAIRRRGGSARLDVATDGTNAMTFNGSSQYVEVAIDTRVWTLGTKFTVRIIANPTTNTGTAPLLRAGVTTPSIEFTTASSKLVVNVWDSAATKTTVTSTDDMPTSTFTAFLTRDGASLSLKIDNGTADTGTMDATNVLRTPVGSLEIARDGTNYYTGVIDSIDLFGSVLSSNADRLLRWPDPFLMPSCLASYHMDADSNQIVKDLSRWWNHGRTQGTPTEVTRLSHQQAPIWAILPYRNRSGQQRVFVKAGSVPYIAELS